MVLLNVPDDIHDFLISQNAVSLTLNDISTKSMITVVMISNNCHIPPPEQLKE